MQEWLREIIDGFNADLPTGCAVRALKDEEQIMLEMLVDGVTIGGPSSSGWSNMKR